MRKILLLATALLPLLHVGATAQVNAAAARNVAVELRENGRVVAASNVRLQLGRAAAISIDGPYSMRLRVDQGEDQNYTVRPNLHAGGPDGWTPLRAPALTLIQGRQGTARVERASGPPLEIAVSVD